MRDYLILGAVIMAVGITAILIWAWREKKKEKEKENTGTVRKEKKEKKPRKKKVSRTVMDLIPIRYYDREHQYYVLENGTIMDLMQFNTKDLDAISYDEKRLDFLKFEQFYKVYGGDMKIITLNFPCNTYHQQQYFREKRDRAKNEVFRHWMDIRLQELNKLEKTHTTREFYLMFFADNTEEYDSNRAAILNHLAQGKEELVTLLPEEKKHQILFKMNNKNALIS